MMEIIFSILIGVLSTIMIAAFFALLVLPVIFYIWMLVDCAKRKFKEENSKVVWILVIALAGLIGAIIYYFAVKIKDKKKKTKHSPK